MFHLQKYYKQFNSRIFPLYFFALKFSILNMDHHIDLGKGKSFEFFMPHGRSDFYGLLILGQKYGQWWIIY